jgi:hypothetical protein
MPMENRKHRAETAELHLGHERFVELNSALRESYSRLDSALAHSLRMAAAMIETAQEIGLEPEKGQKLFRKLQAFSGNVMSSRDDLISVHLEATKIRMRTDQAVVAEGCYPYKPYGLTSDEPDLGEVAQPVQKLRAVS